MKVSTKFKMTMYLRAAFGNFEKRRFADSSKKVKWLILKGIKKTIISDINIRIEDESGENTEQMRKFNQTHVMAS